MTESKEQANLIRPAIYSRTICPVCQSGDTIVKMTVKPTRYHECRACGNRFKTVSTVY